MRKHKNIIKIINILIFIGLSICLFANISVASDQQIDINLAFSPKMSMETGHHLVPSILSLYDWSKDQISPSRDWLQDTLWFVGAQLPLNTWAFLLNHEYFGHGARGRDLDFQEIGYEIPIQWPWPRSASARFNVNYNHIDESILLDIAGVEANTWLSYQTHRKLLINSDDYGNHILFYYLTENDLLSYVRFTTKQLLENDPDLSSGNDINNYYEDLMHKYGGIKNIVADYRLSHRLEHQVVFGMYDFYGYLGYKLYDWSNNWLSGKHNYNFNPPYLEVLGKQFLPGTRVALTPWGVEYYLDIYLKRDTYVDTFYFRKSDGYFEDFWGCGMALENIYFREDMSYSFIIDIYNQPLVNGNTGFNSRPIANQTGFNIAIKPEWQCNITPLFISSIFGEIAYKTKGYVMGQPFYEGAYGYLGMKINF